MADQAEISRRAVLGGGAGIAGIAALTLAGCGNGAKSNAASTDAPSGPPSSSGTSGSASVAPATTSSVPATRVHAGTSTQPAAPASTAHAVPPAAPAPPAGALAKLSAIPVGGSIAATHAGKPITLARQSSGTVAGFTAICTHMGCTVNAGGPELHCPCHGSIFNAFTGQVIDGPASRPLPSIAVHVADGYVVSG
jgi:cytochrome b6-f complex iron-sulfur subunit